MTTRLSRLFLPGVESCWGLAFDPVSSFKLELGGRGDWQQLKINFDHGNLGVWGMSDFVSRTRRNLAPVFQGEDRQKDIVCDSTRHKSKRLFAISFPHTCKLMFHAELYLHESP